MVKTTQRVVIAGASGFIGSALSREFADRGYEVIKLRRGEEGKETWDRNLIVLTRRFSLELTL